jgi:hypothetical protein
MAEPTVGAPPSDRPLEDRLDSWKEIAAYLKRDVTTVQRWERREGMPVHRHQHERMGSVYASRADLDAWMRDRILIEMVPTKGYRFVAEVRQVPEEGDLAQAPAGTLQQAGGCKRSSRRNLAPQWFRLSRLRLNPLHKRNGGGFSPRRQFWWPRLLEERFSCAIARRTP